MKQRLLVNFLIYIHLPWKTADHALQVHNLFTKHKHLCVYRCCLPLASRFDPSHLCTVQMIGGSIKMMQYVLCMCMIAGAYLRSVLSYACMHASQQTQSQIEDSARWFVNWGLPDTEYSWTALEHCRIIDVTTWRHRLAKVGVCKSGRGALAPLPPSSATLLMQ